MSRRVWNPGIDQRAFGRDEETDFDRKEISPWWDGRKFSLSVSREGDAWADIFASKVREILQNFFFGHTRGEILQNVIDRNAKPSDAGFAASLPKFYCNAVFVIHD